MELPTIYDSHRTVFYRIPEHNPKRLPRSARLIQKSLGHVSIGVTGDLPEAYCRCKAWTIDGDRKMIELHYVKLMPSC